MTFTFVTLFPHLMQGYFQDSILKRAIDAARFNIEFIDPRNYSLSKHKKVDDTAFSGGAGMVMSPQPLFDTLDALQEQHKNLHVIFTTPVGKPFTQNDAKRLAKKEHLVLVSGRYEGIDERVIEQYADELFSIGDYILTGGELPSLVMCDAIARNIDGVLGNSKSLDVESFESALLEAPSFTKPQHFRGLSAPSEYLKGNHSKIAALKIGLSEYKTKFFRPKRLISEQKRKLYEK